MSFSQSVTAGEVLPIQHVAFLTTWCPQWKSSIQIVPHAQIVTWFHHLPACGLSLFQTQSNPGPCDTGSSAWRKSSLAG
eukprot:m.1461295 g.1461295  ORF g.1461295 m.1461295 type:complete len:79 (+) comp25131_c0_seq9:5464-5700(+)